MAEEYEFVLRNPYTMYIAGPTKSGKTTFVNNLVKNINNVYSEKPNMIFYFYNMEPPWFHDHLGWNKIIRFIRGTPTLDWLEDTVNEHGSNITVVIDDQALHVTKDIAEMYGVGSSRREVNFIFITQSLFMGNKEGREISRNSNYFVIFKNPRDATSSSVFFSQLDENTKVVKEIYKDATRKPHSYLFIDLHQDTPEENRFLSNVFEENDSPIVLYRPYD